MHICCPYHPLLRFLWNLCTSIPDISARCMIYFILPSPPLSYPRFFSAPSHSTVPCACVPKFCTENNNERSFHSRRHLLLSALAFLLCVCVSLLRAATYGHAVIVPSSHLQPATTVIYNLPVPSPLAVWGGVDATTLRTFRVSPSAYLLVPVCLFVFCFLCCSVCRLHISGLRSGECFIVLQLQRMLSHLMTAPFPPPLPIVHVFYVS